MKPLLRLLLISSVLLLAGCAALPTPFVPEDDTMSFQGMNALVGEEAPGRPLHVLLVHGIGTPTPNGFDPFIAALAGRFGLVQIPPADPQSQWQSCHGDAPAQPALLQPRPKAIPNPSVFKDNRALLYTYNFAPHPTDPPALKVSYLLWAPLNAEVKCGLEQEDGSAPQKQAFAAFAKDFIDDKLADALLYAGSYRKEVIRPSVQGALCKVTEGTWDPDRRKCTPGGAYHDPTVIITHSLGGYMLMDAIQDELHDCQPNKGVGAAEKILEETPVIYMMANQLALLNLSTLRRDPQAPKTTTPAIEAVTKQFAKCWLIARTHARSEGRASQTAISQVVAFSDPNDILSWRLERKNLKLPRPDWGEVAVTNVFMSNSEFTIPGLFSDPTNAHTGYFVNPTVMDMLICGMKDGAVSPCPVSVSAR